MRMNSGYASQQMGSGSPRVLQLRSSRGLPSQAGRLPQQYAHPLMQRTDSFEHDSPSSSSSSTPHSSEHMLRRKTPNGVLSAAYDGTNMIQNGRPHPMKHILLPLTEANADTSLSRPHITQHDLPLRSPAPHHHSSDAQLGTQQSRPQNQVWDPGVKNGFGPDIAWISGPNNAQMDSMLNQIPMQQIGQFQQDGTFYGVMQPSITPPGPTISNDIGPYGPYWPNGTFIPYRPATVRDMRYYPQYSANWLSPAPSAMQGWSGLIKPQNLQYQTSPPSGNMLGMGPGAYDMSMVAGIYANDNSALGFGKPSLDNSLPYDISSADSGQTTPRAAQTPTPSDLGPHSQNAQLRERVFEWAHSAYVNVLEYLKHTRRSANNNRHIHGYHHAHRPNIYPKPPRQPSYDFQTHLNMRKSADSRPSYRLQQSHSSNSIHSDISRKDSTPTPPTGWPSQHVQDPRVAQHQQSWHPQMSGMANGYGPPRNLRRTSGPTSSITSLSTHSQGSPTAAAISALESLTELCQESSWQWVEGILLGGCLAYALCDYHKAMKWFSRILEIDSRYITFRFYLN